MDLPTPTPPPPEGSSSPEPTVLDWLRSILKRQPIPLPPREQAAQRVAEPAAGALGTSEALALNPRQKRCRPQAPRAATIAATPMNQVRSPTPGIRVEFTQARARGFRWR
jgi:hypothetical protein